MLRVIASSRRQAVSAGLVAGTFFSKGCVDENYSATGADAGSAIVEEFAFGPEPEITPVIYPIITKLPDAPQERSSKERSPTRGTSPQQSSSAASHDESPRATEPALQEPALQEPALQERPVVVDKHETSAEPVPVELQREPMMQDAYAAFGSEVLY